MKTFKQLQREAATAHEHNEPWLDFWRRAADSVRELEPVNLARYHRMVQTLMSIVVSGDRPARLCDDLPWLADDAAKPADTGTAARYQGELPILPWADAQATASRQWGS